MATNPNPVPQFQLPTVMAFVDAGYLTLGAQAHLKLPSVPRLDGHGLAAWAASGWAGPGRQVLRTYVYDARYPHNADQYADQETYFDALGAQPGIRLRLGHLVEKRARSSRGKWDQKGVDTLLVLDLVRLAQLRAFDTALVIAGDRDLAEAVRVVADDHARQVFLFSVEGSSPAKELVQSADDHGIIRGAWLRRMLTGQLPTGQSEPPRQP